jgi:hypothetical protein
MKEARTASQDWAYQVGHSGPGQAVLPEHFAEAVWSAKMTLPSFLVGPIVAAWGGRHQMTEPNLIHVGKSPVPAVRYRAGVSRDDPVAPVFAHYIRVSSCQ